VLLILIPLLLLGVIAIGVVAVVGGMAITGSRDAPDPTVASADASTDKAAEPVKTYSVKVDTTPSGGSVHKDGVDLGKAPLEIELPEGVTALTAKSEGYPSRTMPCKVEGGRDNECVISLLLGAPEKDAGADEPATQKVTVLDDEPVEPPKKKPVKKKCDPRKNPKCGFIKGRKP
jgi:hypothetical protein